MELCSPITMNLLSDRYVFRVTFQEVLDTIYNKIIEQGFIVDKYAQKAIAYMSFIIPCISYDKVDQEYLTYKYMAYETMYCSEDSNAATFFCCCEGKDEILDRFSSMALQAFEFLQNTTKWKKDIYPDYDFFRIYDLFMDSRHTNLGGKSSGTPWQQFLQDSKNNCRDLIAGIVTTQGYPEKNIQLIQGIITFKKHESCCRTLMNTAFKNIDSDTKKGLFVSRYNTHAFNVYQAMGFEESNLHKYSDFEEKTSEDDEMIFMTSC